MFWVIVAIAVIILPLLLKPKDSKEQKENARISQEERTNPRYRIEFEDMIRNKYTEEIANKILTNQIEIGMTETMFNELIEYQYYLGKFSFKNEFQYRKHEVMKTKTKTTRRRNRRKFSGEQEFIFNDGVLVKITTT